MQTLTVMFTDLVGSTALRVRLGEEDAERVRERHDRMVRAAISRCGGRIAKHTGDGVMATFDGASDALAASVAVQQSLEAGPALSGSAGDPLAVRIGVSAGDVTVDGEDCFGLPVVEAQRLESAARPGQILVSALVGALARGRGGHVLRPVGALELKGLELPLEALEVVWERAPREPVALPPGLVDRGAFPFGGRAKETEVLLEAWRGVCEPSTRVVLVAGEPGIGKTRLTAHVAQRVVDDGGLVLAGRCDELVGVPYQPFGDALRFQLTRPGGTESLGVAAGELVRLVPELPETVRGLPPPLTASPDAERLRLFDAVRGWLSDVAAAAPVLLVLDDLQWADSGTLLLARHVAVTDPVPGLMIVGTYRDTDLDRRHPLAAMLGELRRRAEVVRVALEGLDAAEVTDLLAGAAGHDLEADALALARSVCDETGGNPFFVGEVVRHLAESGTIVEIDGRWSADAGGARLPEGIREVVGRRVSALPDATQATLSSAAVAGVEFDLGLVAALTHADEDAALDALEPALVAHLVTEVGVGRFRFEHALVRSTLHGELSTTRRARLHRAAAELLEARHAPDLDAVAADLAHHYVEAGGAPDHAIRYARRAAEIALARVAPEEAVRWYAQARELLDGADVQLDAELLCALGHAQAAASMAGWQETLLDAARAAEAIGDRALAADALCVTRRMVLTDADPEGANSEKIALLERAVAAVDDDPARRGRLCGALALELIFTGDIERRRELVEEAEALIAALDDPGDQHRVWMFAGRAAPRSMLQRSYVEKRSARYDRWLEGARVAGDHDAEADALLGIFYMSMMLGIPRHHDVLRDLAALLERFPDPFLADNALLTDMTVALIDGRADDVDARADALLVQWRTHGRAAEGGVYSSSAHLQATRERVGWAPVVDLVHGMIAVREAVPAPRALDGIEAVAMFDAGRIDEAVALVDRFAVNEFADIPDDAGAPVARSLWAEAAARSGRLAACEAMRACLLPYADVHQCTGGWYLGATERYLALLDDALGDAEGADAWFAQADRAHVAMQTPPWIARTRLDRGESLLRRGRHDEAREIATAALDAIGALPLDASRARADALLGATA